jgi:hypothetical protein
MDDEETMWSPAWAMFSTANVSAAWPEATRRAPVPPSSAARRSSTTACVGFMMRV